MEAKLEKIRQLAAEITGECNESLSAFEIFVEIGGSKRRKLEVESDNSVAEVKEKIAEIAEKPAWKLLLISEKDIVLDEARTLESYNIRDGAVLEYFERTSFEIFIKLLTGKIFILQVNQTDTVEDVKKQIEKREGIPIYEQRLIFDSKQLVDSRRLAEHNVQKDALIHLVLRFAGPRPELKKQPSAFLAYLGLA